MYASYIMRYYNGTEKLTLGCHILVDLNMHRYSSLFLKVFKVWQHLWCAHLQGSINLAISILISAIISFCNDTKRARNLKSFESQLTQMGKMSKNFFVILF